MAKGYQVMSRASRSTFGVYSAETPEAALDKWAAAHRWGSWREAQERAPDLFGQGYTMEEGFRLYI